MMKYRLLLLLFLVSPCLIASGSDKTLRLNKKGLSSNSSKNYNFEKDYEIKKERLKPLIGLNVGIGGGFAKGISILKGTIGLDMAGTINDHFAMGCYFSYQSVVEGSLGLLFVHANNRMGFAFLWGIGYSLTDYTGDSDGYRVSLVDDIWGYVDATAPFKISPNIRLGFQLKNRLYFMIDMELSTIGIGNQYFYDNAYCLSKTSFDINFRIGYNFLNKKK